MVNTGRSISINLWSIYIKNLMFSLWEKGLVKCRCMHGVLKMNEIVLNMFRMHML